MRQNVAEGRGEAARGRRGSFASANFPLTFSRGDGECPRRDSPKGVQ